MAALKEPASSTAASGVPLSGGMASRGGRLRPARGGAARATRPRAARCPERPRPGRGRADHSPGWGGFACAAPLAPCQGPGPWHVVRVVGAWAAGAVAFFAAGSIGGTIPAQDLDQLSKAGVAAVFGPGTPMQDIIGFIRTNVKPRSVTA